MIRRFWSRLVSRSALYGNVFGLTPVIVYQMGKVGSMSVFDATIRLPDEYVARMRDSRYYRHFYGSE